MTTVEISPPAGGVRPSRPLPGATPLTIALDVRCAVCAFAGWALGMLTGLAIVAAALL